jgi:Reverse transcriptase (RNA-dependent DNA polymerase)
LTIRIILDKQSDGLVTAREVHAPPRLSDVVDEEDHIKSLSDEDEDGFIAEKKVLIKLKKFIPTILPIPTVDKPVIPKGVEPGRVLTPVELVNILYPKPTFEVSGYSFVMGPKVFTKEAAYDNIKPIKYKDMFEVPLTFEQAWNHPCPWQHARWRAAILLELEKMRRMCLWKKVKRSIIPRGRKCIKCKWVFDIKHNGVFRARLVACVYSQVPGIDFQDAYSPVINDATFRLLLLIQLIIKLKARLADPWRS